MSEPIEGYNTSRTPVRQTSVPGSHGNEYHPKEQALIEYCRGLQFGTVTIQVENGLPVRAVEAQKSIKF